MSIALEIGGGIGGAGFICGIGCVPIYDLTEIEKDPPLPLASPSSSSFASSSIGEESDGVGRELEDDEGAGMGEVQSAYKGLLQGMESMEESLPIRRGISNFYAGKSKSFTSLSDAISSCASTKDLAKAENAYSRRRRNLLASKIFWEKPQSNLLRSPSGGIAKRPAAAHKRSPLALAVAMGGSPRTSNISEYQGENHQFLPQPAKSTTGFEDPVNSSSSSSQLCSFPMRSFSLGDLPVLKNSGSSVGSREDQ
ncbi:uncharacterized protein LOC110104980 [Dendrobium catenatum]|uniref:Uncharacterized protein n=1 Tax=Dendrobium catenatum TaxID=906689 RepID=A0A2I0X1Q8_9ASPA|nr:uncharacterized protein LOC110104980 [Dendrobium catenatum]PKU81840.1 hypothetical protein MA16_Dca003856 [Dendrobium catenatum]